MKTKPLIQELKDYYRYLDKEFQELFILSEVMIITFMLFKLFVITLEGGKKMIKNEMNRIKYLYKGLTGDKYNLNKVLSIILIILTYPLSIIVRIIIGFINLFRKKGK